MSQRGFETCYFKLKLKATLLDCNSTSFIYFVNETVWERTDKNILIYTDKRTYAYVYACICICIFINIHILIYIHMYFYTQSSSDAASGPVILEGISVRYWKLRLVKQKGLLIHKHLCIRHFLYRSLSLTFSLLFCCDGEMPKILVMQNDMFCICVQVSSVNNICNEHTLSYQFEGMDAKGDVWSLLHLWSWSLLIFRNNRNMND